MGKHHDTLPPGDSIGTDLGNDRRFARARRHHNARVAISFGKRTITGGDCLRLICS